MTIKKIMKYILIIIAVFIVVNSTIYTAFIDVENNESDITLKNESISLNNINKIEKVLSNLGGNDYYKGINITEDYTENLLCIFYSINNILGESDYINFWNDINKKEIIIFNAIYMFLSIDELDKVKINLGDSIGEEFVINRNDIEKVYNRSLEECDVNEKNLSEFMAKDSIEEMWYLVNG